MDPRRTLDDVQCTVSSPPGDTQPPVLFKLQPTTPDLLRGSPFRMAAQHPEVSVSLGTGVRVMQAGTKPVALAQKVEAEVLRAQAREAELNER